MSTISKIPPITMSKLYVGNLPNDANENVIRQLFCEQNLSCTNILVKKGGYAFVDCQDQSSADRAIDKLNNFNFNGVNLIVEPSVASGKKKSVPNFSEPGLVQVGNGWIETSKIIVSNIPRNVRYEDIQHLFQQYGRIVCYENLTSKEIGQTQMFAITYENNEDAKTAVDELNDVEIDGRDLKIELAVEKMGRRPVTRGNSVASLSVQNRQNNDFPLRILVQSDMVGAIIGRQGTTIRHITQVTRARVDVHRKDNVGSLEKAITIYGTPEACSSACKKILEVMKQEAHIANKNDIQLKILAHNNLIGRIIGKNGSNIRKIMQETETKITVSSINDLNSFNLERVITIKGSVENMSRAEYFVSSKLRQSFENDLHAMIPHTIMFPGLHPMALLATSGFGYSTRGVNNGQPHYPGLFGNSQAGGDSHETTYMYIPNSVVGAVIGTKGNNIRSIIRFSGASVKIASIDESLQQGNMQERRVTVVGSPEAQWKAQYLIFDKIREECFNSGLEEVRLTIELIVPTCHVGRIIGRGGQNVRELQRITGAVVKLPDQCVHEDETAIHIIGTFLSVQSAQRKIRSLILHASLMHHNKGRSLRYIRSQSSQSDTTYGSSDQQD